MSDASTPDPGHYGATPEPPQYGQSDPNTGAAPYGAPQNYGPPPGYGPAPTYPVGQAGYQYPGPPEDPGAQNAMIVSLVGLVLGFTCGVGFLASPFGLVMGLKAKQRIDASGGKLGGRGNAQAGFVMGVVGTAMLALAILAAIVLIVLIAFAVNDSTIIIDDSGVRA